MGCNLEEKHRNTIISKISLTNGKLDVKKPLETIEFFDYSMGESFNMWFFFLNVKTYNFLRPVNI